MFPTFSGICIFHISTAENWAELRGFLGNAPAFFKYFPNFSTWFSTMGGKPVTLRQHAAPAWCKTECRILPQCVMIVTISEESPEKPGILFSTSCGKRCGKPGRSVEYPGVSPFEKSESFLPCASPWAAMRSDHRPGTALPCRAGCCRPLRRGIPGQAPAFRRIGLRPM